MTPPPSEPDPSKRDADATRDRDFPAKRHVVPLPVYAPNALGFSTCTIAPGLEIRESTQADKDLLAELNRIHAPTLTLMHTVPLLDLKYLICVDEQVYGHVLEQKIVNTGNHTDLGFKRFHLDDIYKMIVTALHLFYLVPLLPTRYFITEEYESNHHYLGFLNLAVQPTWDAWHRYAVPNSRGYNIVRYGTITCADVILAVSVLEKYYRYNYWLGNRVAVALHNFWNALFLRESTLAFVSLVTVIETFTNLSKGADTTEQVYRNTLKLAPIDGHGNAVTRERLEEMYNTRSVIAHGSFGRDETGPATWNVTHLDAKFSNVDVRLSTGIMSIVARLLHRVLFDPAILSLLEGAKTSIQERRQLRRYLDAMP